MRQILLTIPELGAAIQKRIGGDQVPAWKLRRVVDSLQEAGRLKVFRMGLYRTVSDDQIQIVAEAVRAFVAARRLTAETRNG